MTQERISVAQYRAQVKALEKAHARSPRHNKFGAKSIVIDGHFFPSLLEGRRYGQLKMLQRTGIIRDLKLQPRFDLSAGGEKVAEYRADFSYEERLKSDGPFPAWRSVVEDTKGVMTPLYRLKKALFLRLYPQHDFREIKRR